MFSKIDTYDYMSVFYNEKVYLLVSKHRLEGINFTNEFLAIAECINMQGRFDKLSNRAIKAIKKVDIESVFIKDTVLLSSEGIMFIFNEENKQLVLSFFNNIPFFNS